LETKDAGHEQQTEKNRLDCCTFRSLWLLVLTDSSFPLNLAAAAQKGGNSSNALTKARLATNKDAVVMAFKKDEVPHFTMDAPVQPTTLARANTPSRPRSANFRPKTADSSRPRTAGSNRGATLQKSPQRPSTPGHGSKVNRQFQPLELSGDAGKQKSDGEVRHPTRVLSESDKVAFNQCLREMKIKFQQKGRLVRLM
jgi:hypothetical protein